MKSILIKTLGDNSNGMGHIVRTWNLAQELISRGVKVGFSTSENTAGYNYLHERIPTTRIGLNDQFHYENCIIDIENGPTKKLLQDTRAKYSKVIVIGGVGFPMADQKAINELVDLQIYQSVIVTNKVSAENSLGGCEYVILGKDYQSLVPFDYTMRRGGVVCMGGADPHQLTKVVCEQLLSSFNGYRPTIQAVFGSASKTVNLPLAIKPVYFPPTLSYLFQSARFAVTALGMTTYEAACFGVPTASINWSEDHELTAQALEDLGVTVNLGLWDNPDWNKMGTFVDKMHNEGAWRKMSEAGRALVDGKGAGRVADKIVEIL